MFACKISYAPDQPVAIVVILPDSGRVELTDTFRPRAVAWNAVGDSVQADIFWTSLDTTVLKVLDSATGVSVPKIDSSTGVPKAAGSSARLQARTGRLLANPQTIQVLARLDSMTADSLTRDTLDVTPGGSSAVDSLSSPLKIRTFAYGGIAPGRRVVFSFTTYPASGPVITLLPRDTVTTGGDGKASVQVRLHPGAVPDSVVVTATMRKFHGASLPGSPVTFVVEFRP